MPDNFAAIPQPVDDHAFIFSYSGQKIGLGLPPPSLEDIAVSLGRICRFTGHCRVFYPVLIHSFIVSDLCRPEDRRAALLHDSAEIYTGDIPTPFKSPEMKFLERRLLSPILSTYLSPEELLGWINGGHVRVKSADQSAFAAEVCLFGCDGLRKWLGGREPFVEAAVQSYMATYPLEDCVRPDGAAVVEFVRRMQ